MNFSAFALTRALFLLKLVVLVVFGLGSLMRIPANPDSALLYGFYALAMFGDALLMGICLWQLSKHTRAAFWLAVSVLVLNIVPTIFDQFGLADLLFVLLNMATLTTLLFARKELSPA